MGKNKINYDDIKRIKKFLKREGEYIQYLLYNYFDSFNINRPFDGLCYKASKMFIKRINDHPICLHPYKLKIDTIHGELAHGPIIDSCNWPMQHTMNIVSVLYNEKVQATIWVDCTCAQFKHEYPYMPDIYVSEKKPKWFYPDKYNPIWGNKVIRKLNEHIQFERHVKSDNEIITVHDGIIELIQYEIWGRVSDIIRKSYFIVNKLIRRFIKKDDKKFGDILDYDMGAFYPSKIPSNTNHGTIDKLPK